MPRASFRFYGELNDFLPAVQRQTVIPCRLSGPVAVKHLIEALGIPHAEVHLLLANGISADFAYPVQPGDRFNVYPACYELNEAQLQKLRPLLQQLRPPLPSPPRFILDNHLGKLATYLRLLGFDALYDNDYQDDRLAHVSHMEQRVLLTRDRRLLMRKVVVYGYWLRTKDPRQQLMDVLRRYRLNEHIQPWHRCLRCNGQLEPVPKEAILERLEPKTTMYFHEFHICQDCEQIYWKGSHYEPLRRFVDSIKGDEWSRQF